MHYRIPSDRHLLVVVPVCAYFHHHVSPSLVRPFAEALVPDIVKPSKLGVLIDKLASLAFASVVWDQ